MEHGDKSKFGINTSSYVTLASVKVLDSSTRQSALSQSLTIPFFLSNHSLNECQALLQSTIRNLFIITFTILRGLGAL